MPRTRYKPEIKRNSSFTLNITSMTDMFTIMLVFLLQSFAASEVQIDMVEKLRLPQSSTDKNPVHGIQVSLSQKELKLDQTTLARIENAQLQKDSLDVNDPSFIKPLFDELSKRDKAQKDTQKKGQILLQADQDLPYELIRKVMYTASMAGFPQVKLVTIAGQ